MSDEGKFNPEEWFEKKFKEIRNIMHDDVKKLSVDEYKKLTDFHRENEKQMEEFFMEKNKDRDKDDRIHGSDYQQEQKDHYEFIDNVLKIRYMWVFNYYDGIEGLEEKDSDGNYLDGLRKDKPDWSRLYD